MAHTKYGSALFEKIVETAESLIVIWDPAGNIRFINRKAQEVTGYKDEEVLGKKWMDVFVPPKYQPDFRRLLDSLAQESSVPRRAEYPILSKDGKEILIAWDRTLIRDEGGKTEGPPEFNGSSVSHVDGELDRTDGRLSQSPKHLSH